VVQDDGFVLEDDSVVLDLDAVGVHGEPARFQRDRFVLEGDRLVLDLERVGPLRDALDVLPCRGLREGALLPWCSRFPGTGS
jgi:hypothetical protein